MGKQEGQYYCSRNSSNLYGKDHRDWGNSSSFMDMPSATSPPLSPALRMSENTGEPVGMGSLVYVALNSLLFALFSSSVILDQFSCSLVVLFSLFTLYPVISLQSQHERQTTNKQINTDKHT